MSLEAMAWAWRQPVRGTKKLVLLCLADWANHEHRTWHPTRDLLDRVGVGRSALFTALRELEDDGLIVRDERERDDGGRAASLYVLPVESGLPHTPSGEPDGPPSSGPDPVNPKEEPREKKESDDSQEVDPVDDVWATFVDEMAPRRRDVDPESRRIIREALKVADVAELKRAIQGNKASAFHQGANDRGKKYNQLSQILKGKRGGRTAREQIDFFIEIADRSGITSPGVPSADPGKVNSAKRWVLTAWEFPENSHAQEQGTEATEWLAKHGWAVEHAADGRPTFRWVGA